MATTLSLADAACRYAELGYPVFPLKPGAKVPATEHGLKDATTDHATIAAWWAAAPNANIGLRTDGLLVIDADGRDNPWVTPEQESLLAGAAQAQTPKGRHWVFRAPDGADFRNTAGRLATNVDTRGNGGYIVVAPSIVANKPYAWTIDIPPRAELPEPPPEIVAALRAVPRPAVPPTANGQAADVGNLARSTLLFLQFGAPEGERNARLFSAACDLSGNNVDQGKAESMLSPPATRCGMEPVEIAKSIASAYREPRTPTRAAELSQEQLDAAFGGGASAPPTENAARHEPPAVRCGLSNVETKWKTGPDGKEYPEIWYRQIDTLADALAGTTGGWPKSCNGLLFVLDGRGGVRYLNRTPELFSWMARFMDTHWSPKKEVRCATGTMATPATKEEFHAHLKDTVTDRYVSVSSLPHYPPMPGVFYLPIDLPHPTGKALEGFLAGLNPETPDDRELLRAAILIGVWGGSCGQRPAFIFSSRHGRGSGKTATALAVAEIFGGAFVIAPKESWEQVGKRILSDSALAQRYVLRDNVKSKISGEEMESLITLPQISGWRPYHGHFTRPNNLVYLVTANTPRMGNDMAERSISIEIGDRKHGNDFMRWYREYVAEHRLQIVADCLAALAGPDQGTIPPGLLDRWSEFQRGVLQKCRDPERLAALIADRRRDVDAENEDAEGIAAAISSWVSTNNPPTNRDGKHRITRDQMHGLLLAAKAISDDMGKRGTYTYLCNMLGSHGPLRHLTDSPSRCDGERCWLWEVELDIPI